MVTAKRDLHELKDQVQLIVFSNYLPCIAVGSGPYSSQYWRFPGNTWKYTQIAPGHTPIWLNCLYIYIIISPTWLLRLYLHIWWVGPPATSGTGRSDISPSRLFQLYNVGMDEPQPGPREVGSQMFPGPWSTPPFFKICWVNGSHLPNRHCQICQYMIHVSVPVSVPVHVCPFKLDLQCASLHIPIL